MSNELKVILNGFGYMCDKRFLKATKGMSEFEWRTNEDVIALVEKKHREINYLLNLEEDRVITESQKGKLRKLMISDWLHFKIRTVDTSRKWCIQDYDTSTSIRYLDEVDSSLNFYGFI